MKRILITVITLLMLNFPMLAQYDFAVGLRSGGTSGLTLKRNYAYSTVEGIVGVWNDGLSLTGLYERHPNAGARGLHWIYGAGGHVAFYNAQFRGRTGPSWYVRDEDIQDGAVGIGIDGIVGIEYKIPPIPLAISADLKPFIEVNSADVVWFSLDPGIGIKLAF